MKGGLSCLRNNVVSPMRYLRFSTPSKQRCARARTLSLEKDLSTEKTSRFRVLGLHGERDYTLFRYRRGL